MSVILKNTTATITTRRADKSHRKATLYALVAVDLNTEGDESILGRNLTLDDAIECRKGFGELPDGIRLAVVPMDSFGII